MKKPFEKIIELAKEIHLDATEKASLKDDLVLLMRMRPVASSATTSWRTTLMRRGALAFGIGVLVVGSVSYAAEGSLPGDLLYPVKINVTEQVVTWATRSPRRQAIWHTQLVERRLEEVERLASRGFLDNIKAAEVEARIETETNNVASHIDALENKKELETAATISSNLESTLRAHERILLNLTARTPQSRDDKESKKNHEESSKMAESLKEKRNRMTNKRTSLEAKIATSTESSATIKRRSVETTASEVTTLLTSLSSSLDIPARTKAKIRLERDKKMIREGSAAMELKSNGDAFRLFQKAERSLQETRLILEAHKKLNISPEFNGEHEDTDTSDNTSEPQEHADESFNDTIKDFQNQRGKLQFDTRL